MRKIIVILALFALTISAGCFPKKEFQKALAVGLEPVFKSGIFITTAALVYHIENGRWPESTEALKNYCYEMCKETKIIDWDNYKIQTISDNEGEKLKIDYKSANLSYSTILSKPVTASCHCS
jgi:hypothetical protein